MNQKTDNLSSTDLVIIKTGYLRIIVIGMFLSSSDVSVTYIDIKRNTKEHIRTRHSTDQRVYKITEDNLTKEQLILYNNLKQQYISQVEKSKYL